VDNGTGTDVLYLYTQAIIFRDKIKQFNGGHLPIWGECIAGGMGGASQVRQFKKTERYSMFHLSFVNYMK
jgi:hypothetical protein